MSSKNEVNKLNHKIQMMKYDWDNERKLYNKEMLESFYAQKVETIIAEIETIKEVSRPFENLDKEYANEIVNRCCKKLDKMNVRYTIGYKYDENNCCHIGVKILGDK